MFQTLIGAVKSLGPDGVPVCFGNMFQTLIGTVKSGAKRVEEELSRRVFQTLIGTVKSLDGYLLHIVGTEVSNPHRYGQKAYLSPHPLVGKGEFQTLIGTVKSRREGGRIREGLQGVSNPHRYGQKRGKPGGHAGRPPVSNPHRYGQKLVSSTWTFMSLDSFQTLIGTVKRADASSCTLGSHRTLSFVFKNPCGRHGGNPAA